MMSRLADYFVIVGYDHSKTGAGGAGVGKIIQRFPEKDWDNCPFTQGIELFCQPRGWYLTPQKQPPTFFVSVLTDIDAYRHYCACLTFSEDVVMETVAKEHLVDDDDGEEEGEGVVRCSKLYAPKSLVLVSRLDCFEVFRNCLGIIYATYIDNLSISFELLVANILTSVLVPPHGGPLVKFSIGAGDRQSIQPSSCPTLPTTSTSVALLFEQLGISNCLTVFCAALCDHKVLFHSMSYSRLTDSSHAITSLMYPLKYSYVYIPLLPVGLLEVLSTPTPFIAGVHTSHKPDQSELLDVVVADLDGGSIKLPDNVHISLMPQPMLNRMRQSLQQILRPDLTLADTAFSSAIPKLSPPEILDKEIRAIFLRFFAELFMHYRSCLNLIRIHPEPVITFHKASFLGNRGLMDDDFMKKVLDSMSFNTFVMERGPPYRICDIFDDVFDKMHETLKIESDNPSKSIQHIRELAEKLYNNENPTQPVMSQKVPRPTEGSHLRVHQPLFPLLDEVKVHELIQEGMSKWDSAAKMSPVWQQYPRIVPTGTRLTHSQMEKAQLVSTNARRLEVLRNCIAFIFENKISDARKIFPAVLKVLKTKVARLLLVEELGFHVKSNRSLLEHQQFEMVVRLLNCALQNDSVMDENGVATAILPLAMSFCRKLFTGVIQFAYTCVQDHPVWASQQFWEAAFYQDVQQQICQLYVNQKNNNQSLQHLNLSNSTDDANGTDVIGSDTTLRRNDSKRWSTLSLTPPNNIAHQRSIAALEIAAEQMRLWPNMSEDEKSEMIKNEESTVYSQAIHYANRMVYLRIPLDATKTPKDVLGMEGESLSSMVTNSAADSDSMDGESGIDDPDMNEIGASVAKFVLRFIDKMCMESGVSPEHTKSLHQMVPGVIDMHMETLEAIHQEILRLPPMPKPRILTPILLVGEEMLIDGLRAYLIPDGREEGTGGVLGGPAYLPAEGAIFLTSYRVIFKGTSCDPLVGEQSICRSFPISSLTKEKKLNAQYLNHKDLWLQEALQLRSASFQMLKAAFDEEVSTEEIEIFRKWLVQLRHPASIMLTFAFSRVHCSVPPINYMGKSKEKNVSLKSFAKKTLLKTARKAGLKTKDYSSTKRSPKYMLPTPPLNRKIPYNYNHFTLDHDDQYSSFNEELSVIDEQEVKVQILNDAKNLERISERSYCRDFFRLGLGSIHLSNTHHPIRPRPDQFRLSAININSSYAVCYSYPAVLPVPYTVSDDCLQKICKSHRQNRFPVATWRHPTTKALLIRGSGFHGKGVMGVFKGHYNNSSAGSPQVDSTGVAASSMTVEQEKYFSSIISCTPPVKNGTTLLAHPHAHLPSSITSMTMTSSPNKPHHHHALHGQRDTITYLTSQTKHNFQKVLTNFKTASFKDFTNNHRLNRRHHQKQQLQQQQSPVRDDNKKLPEIDITLSRASMKGTLFRDRRPGTAMPGGKLSQPESPSTLGVAMRQQQQNGFTMNSSTMISDMPHSFYKSTLYVLGEKAQMKGLRIESLGKCDFVPIEFNEVRNVKASLKKFMRACVPSTVLPTTNVAMGGQEQGSSDGKRGGMLKCIQESGWMGQIENILKVAGLAIDLIDLQGSSVMICLEDGWDFTTQVMSVAQILLDPYYRTIEGFKVLIEKEWLAFGHRFSHRCNQTEANQASGFAPIFLQFLDVVHQIHNQFPMSFEFNQFYLRFLAFHHLSNRFRTFMLDSELKRVELGWHSQQDRSNRHDNNHIENDLNGLDLPSNGDPPDNPSCAPLSFHHSHYHNQDVSSLSYGSETLNHSSCQQTHQRVSGAKNSSSSIWDYIDVYHKRSPVFYNFLYCSRDHETVLRPYSTCSNLKIWDYYFSENLCSGTPYDLELREFDLQKDDDLQETNKTNELPSKSPTNSPSNQHQQGLNRKVVNGCYDNIELLQPDSCSHLLMEIFRLDSELNNRPAPRGWIEQWESLEVPTHEFSSTLSMATNHQSGGFWEEQRRRLALQQSNHKKLTVEMLYRSKHLTSLSSSSTCMMQNQYVGLHDNDEENKVLFSQTHSFMPHYYTTPTQCNYCSQVLWGLIKSGYHCSNCGYSCHEKCLNLVPKNCTGVKSMIEVDTSSYIHSSTTAAAGANNQPYSSVSRKDGTAETFLKFSSGSNEHRTHEGYLYKRGVMLKGWKLRWFVLDSVKHQLRYYDSPEDANCKGYVDLADIVSVAPIRNVPGAPKKSEDGAFFELKTVRRVYHFYATDFNSVQDWIDKIQLCI